MNDADLIIGITIVGWIVLLIIYLKYRNLTKG